jgi:hypothetical protein
VEVLEGENVDDVTQNTHLGAFELTRDVETVSVNDVGVQVEVQMWLDSDGVIDAVVRDVKSGQTKAITLNRNR